MGVLHRPILGQIKSTRRQVCYLVYRRSHTIDFAHAELLDRELGSTLDEGPMSTRTSARAVSLPFA